MNALRGEFDYAIALECFAFVIEYDDVTGARLRPMQSFCTDMATFLGRLG
jgi:hypothetical protein